ncbi:MAG: hypothetical protein IKY82_00990 [Alistipes sp.]|nr:hypothetical protein [Alistipes sp.]
MKKIALILTKIFAFWAIVIAVGCSKEGDNSPTDYPDTPHGRITIAHLKSMCRAESQIITEDISIEGYIVVNDLYKEFVKSIIVGDDSGCIEIDVDTDSTAEIFTVGARIIVYCSSLAIGEYGGNIRLGAAPSGSYSVDRIKREDFSRYFLLDISYPKAIEPTVKKIEDITTADIGNYIMLNDVTFTDGGAKSWCDIDDESGKYITTEREIADPQGNTLLVRTISDCVYRDETLPEGKVSLCGIVEYFGGKFSLRVINHQIVI